MPQIKRLGHRELALHFGAQIEHLRRNRRTEAAHAVTGVAVTVALDLFGTRREQAVAWLTTCAVKYASHHYDNAVQALHTR